MDIDSLTTVQKQKLDDFCHKAFGVSLYEVTREGVTTAFQAVLDSMEEVSKSLQPKTPTFTVMAGRQIYRDGKRFIAIGNEGDNPTEADFLTRKIAFWLNLEATV